MSKQNLILNFNVTKKWKNLKKNTVPPVDYACNINTVEFEMACLPLLYSEVFCIWKSVWSSRDGSNNIFRLHCAMHLILTHIGKLNFLVKRILSTSICRNYFTHIYWFFSPWFNRERENHSEFIHFILQYVSFFFFLFFIPIDKTSN